MSLSRWSRVDDTGFFSASLGSRMPGRDWKRPRRSPLRFFLLHFRYQLRSFLGLCHQPMWMTLTMFGFHNPCCARTAWPGPDSDAYFYWTLQALGSNFMVLSFESILRRFYLVFRLIFPPDYTMSLFRSRLSFQFITSPPNLIVQSQFGE